MARSAGSADSAGSAGIELVIVIGRSNSNGRK
jgi:hypothetical protein